MIYIFCKTRNSILFFFVFDISLLHLLNLEVLLSSRFSLCAKIEWCMVTPVPTTQPGAQYTLNVC